MRRILGCLGIVLGVIVVIIVVAAIGLSVTANNKLNATYNNPVSTLSAANGNATHGQLLVTAIPGCAGCHASDLTQAKPVLDGGLVTDVTALGNFYAQNLTPGGPLKDYSDGEIIRAIREGIAKDGRGLAVMPSDSYKFLSDADVQDIVAYIRSMPAVNKTYPKPVLSPLGTVLIALGQLDTSHQQPVANVKAPQSGRGADRGEYLKNIGGCTACHGPALDAKNIPQGPPPGPSLAVVGSWTEQQFIQTIRTGKDPAGHQLADTMPWRDYAKSPDDDLAALYAYIKANVK